jgi:CysZ protein
MPVAESASSTVKQFFSGVALFFRGLRLMARRPGLYLLGVVPGLISFLILAAAVTAVVAGLDGEVRVLTGFTQGWATWLRTTIDVAARIAVVGVSVLISIWAFTSLALFLGQPFFERICSVLDDEAGVAPGPASNILTDMLIGLRDSLRVGVLVAVVGLGLFLAEFIPVVGQTVVPVLAALFGGWTLVVELTGPPFTRRGFDLVARRARLHQHRAEALGLGVMIFVVFLIPLGAVLFMPVAVAAATVLTQRIAPGTTADPPDLPTGLTPVAQPPQH